jgi:hypothetical protein
VLMVRAHSGTAREGDWRSRGPDRPHHPLGCAGFDRCDR